MSKMKLLVLAAFAAIATISAAFGHPLIAPEAFALGAMVLATDYVQPGETITGIAPYNVASGAGALLGSHLFGVALYTVLSGAQAEFRLIGVWDLACLSTDVPVFGALMYWDNTNKRVTTTSASNTLIGVYVSPTTKVNGALVARVRLNGISV